MYFIKHTQHEKEHRKVFWMVYRTWYVLDFYQRFLYYNQMRQIKFRGFSKDCNNWVYGSLIEKGIFKEQRYYEIFSVISGSWVVEKESIGQFTGLYDKNGVEIYEGDILSFITQRKNGFHQDGEKVILKPVQFGDFCYNNNVIGDFIGFHIDGSSIKYKLSHGCEIVGNIHQKPELIK